MKRVIVSRSIQGEGERDPLSGIVVLIDACTKECVGGTMDRRDDYRFTKMEKHDTKIALFVATSMVNMNLV